MPRDAAELAHRLAREAEAVCRHYLSNGRREGRYWLVGDVQQYAGSLDVRPSAAVDEGAAPANGPMPRPASMAISSMSSAKVGACVDFREVAEEARRFLKLPRIRPGVGPSAARPPVPAGSQEAARRLFAISSPIEGTVVETYLQHRGIAHVHHGSTACASIHAATIDPMRHLPTETWPAMIACVTDLAGQITGVHRTWLDPTRSVAGKAPIDTPRRAMGDLLGNAVRFGVADDVLAAGEGIETMLSLRCIAADLADGRSTLRQSPRRHRCSRERCAGSISPATPMPPETGRWQF